MKTLIYFILVFLNPFIDQIVSVVYGDIWKLKDKLKMKKTIFRFEVYNRYFNKRGSWVGYKSIMHEVPCFPHKECGIFISNDAEIGKNVVIFHQVTIGSNTIPDSKGFGSPTICDNVYIGAGAKIIGKVKIGNNCRIGANAVVYEDMPDNSVAVQAPTRIIHKHCQMDNRFFSQRNTGSWVYYNNGQWKEAELQNTI